ncbi:MAG: hypothetical protein EOM80_04185 [Erysipelotrichia bacterium]|nr:hypothetical protein [Erysipelotrichia bacterium]
MTKSLKIRIICLVLAFFSSASFCYAQLAENLDLQLKSTTKRKTGKFVRPPRNGEFKLSLGSQMLTEEETSIEPYESEEITEVFSDASANSFADFSRSDLTTRPSPRKHGKSLSSTITLNNSYEDNSIEMNNSTPAKLAFAGKNGRLQLYGEFEQRHMIPIQTADTAPFKTSSNASSMRASSVTSEPEGLSNQGLPAEHDKNTALSSKYYLEAVYNFRPTLKGKVSFKRAMIDTFESEENLQVEGIVEANRNILIKAGYNNETRPEVTEPKSTSNTKVWTEFILKF